MTAPGPTPPAAAPARGSRRWVLAGVAALAAAAGAGVAWQRFRLEEADTSGFWGHSFPTPEGGTLALAELRGLDQGTQRLQDRAQVLGLAVDQVEPVRRFLARAPVSFPVALAGLAGVDLTRALGNAAGGLPFSVVFDAQGALRHRKIGQIQPADLAVWRG